MVYISNVNQASTSQFKEQAKQKEAEKKVKQTEEVKQQNSSGAKKKKSPLMIQVKGLDEVSQDKDK